MFKSKNTTPICIGAGTAVLAMCMARYGNDSIYFVLSAMIILSVMLAIFYFIAKKRRQNPVRNMGTAKKVMVVAMAMGAGAIVNYLLTCYF